MVGFCCYHQLSRCGDYFPPGVVKELQGGQFNLKKQLSKHFFIQGKITCHTEVSFSSLIYNLHIHNCHNLLSRVISIVTKDSTIYISIHIRSQYFSIQSLSPIIPINVGKLPGWFQDKHYLGVVICVFILAWLHTISYHIM